MRFKIPAKQPARFQSSALYLAGRTRGQSTDRVEWLETRNLETRDPVAAAAVMDATAARNVRCKAPVYHFVLSFDPKDEKAKRISPEAMREIAAETIERLGLQEHQLMVYAHRDTKHPHMHFLVNRIHPLTGKAFDRHEDGKRLTGLCRDIARERGLNIPNERARIKERERVDDFDDVARAIPEGEYWQARADAREAQVPMSKAEAAQLREKVEGHFHNARDWGDLTARLGAHGVTLERKGQGLVLAQGERVAKLSQMGKGVRLAGLEERFGERFEAFTARRMQTLEREDAPEAQIPGYDEMTPAERRRAERLHTAKQSVLRKRGDPVRELEAADFDYRYWTGVQSIYRNAERRIARLERERGWLNKVAPNFEARERKARETFSGSLLTAFRNPAQAEARWQKLEKAHGLADAQRMVRANPALLGRMNGRRLFGKDTPERQRAKRAFRYLDNKRRRWRETQHKLGHHRHRIEANRQALRIALHDLEMMRLRTDVPQRLRAIIRERINRRQKALSRVTEQMIRQSDIANDRKEDLIRARKRHLDRQRDLERGRDRGFGPDWWYR